jgi:hypothetical protein
MHERDESERRKEKARECVGVREEKRERARMMHSHAPFLHVQTYGHPAFVILEEEREGKRRREGGREREREEKESAHPACVILKEEKAARPGHHLSKHHMSKH